MGLQKESSLGKKNIIFLISAYCAFITYAFYLNGFGPNAPVMMAYYGTSSAQQGFILTVQSIGALLVAIYLALQGDRYNKISAAAIGLLIVGASSISIGFAPSYTQLLLVVVAAGVGYTILDVMANGIIAEMFPNQKSTLIPLLHAFFGAGAMVSPLFVASLANPYIPISFTRPFMLVGILAVVVFVLFFIVSRRIMPETPYADMDKIKRRGSGDPAAIFKEKKAWLILAAGFLYFTFQIGLVSWLPSYCLDIGMEFSTAGGMLTAFFLGSLIMRFCGPLFLKMLTAQRAYIIFSLLTTAIIVAALFVIEPMVMMPLLIIGGFMQGSCVAFLFLMAVDAFPHMAGSASSLILIAVNSAAMTAPLWMGFIAEFSETGFRVPLLLGCASLAFSVLIVICVNRNRNHRQ